jgi:hypothetical protein
VTDRGDPSTLDVHDLDRAEVELGREHGVPSVRIARGHEVDIPADLLAGWRAADARRRALIEATRGQPLFV